MGRAAPVADIYGLGGTLFTLARRIPPDDAPTRLQHVARSSAPQAPMTATARRVADELLGALAAAGDVVDDAATIFAWAVARAMELAPEPRWASAAAFGAALGEAARRKSGWTRTAPPWPGAERRAQSVVGALGLPPVALAVPPAEAHNPKGRDLTNRRPLIYREGHPAAHRTLMARSTQCDRGRA